MIMITKLAVGFKIATRINKPIREVFEAVADPQKLCRYFTTTASGGLDSDETVLWTWGDIQSEVYVDEFIDGSRIIFRWEAYKVPYETICTISFSPVSESTTQVIIEETGWQNDQAGLESAFEHCAGWQHMLLCMKAWLEYGLDLRNTD